MNATWKVYCAEGKCNVGGKRGNRGEESSGLTLIYGQMGYGVVTKNELKSDVIVGDHCGNILSENDMYSEIKARGFTCAFLGKSNRGLQVYIDASRNGSICNFFNHSCSLNCYFYEMSNRSNRNIIVVALKDIDANSELIVECGKNVWFDCRCCEKNCVCKRN